MHCTRDVLEALADAEAKASGLMVAVQVLKLLLLVTAHGAEAAMVNPVAMAVVSPWAPHYQTMAPAVVSCANA